MSTIQEDVKTQQFKNIYLLCGNESYQRNRYRDFIKNALCKNLDSMNINTFSGKDVSVQEIIDLSETLPFFADRRVLIVENCGLFHSSGESLATYLEHIPDSSFFIFVEEDIDKRSKLYKICNNNGKVENCEMLKGDELKKWILQILTRDKKQITQDAYFSFVEKTDSDMNNMRMELEKLICYIGDRDGITVEDVNAVCNTRVNSRVFDLVDAIARKNQMQALNIYADMLEMREPPMRILFLIARQFNLLMMAKELKAKGIDKNTMAGKMGVQPFVAEKCVVQSSKFSLSEIRQAIEDCVVTEESIKTGKITDQLGVEMIIIQKSC